jgi:hypothetical protein
MNVIVKRLHETEAGVKKFLAELKQDPCAGNIKQETITASNGKEYFEVTAELFDSLFTAKTKWPDAKEVKEAPARVNVMRQQPEIKQGDRVTKKVSTKARKAV